MFGHTDMSKRYYPKKVESKGEENRLNIETSSISNCYMVGILAFHCHAENQSKWKGDLFGSRSRKFRSAMSSSCFFGPLAAPEDLGEHLNIADFGAMGKSMVRDAQLKCCKGLEVEEVPTDKVACEMEDLGNWRSCKSGLKGSLFTRVEMMKRWKI